MLAAEDTLAIIDLVHRADNAATTRDHEGYASLYTENGIMEGSQGDYFGRAAIVEATKEVWGREPAGSQHLTLNLTISETGGSIIAHSWLVVASPNDLKQIVAVAEVTQTIEKTADGWRIVRRQIAQS